MSIEAAEPLGLSVFEAALPSLRPELHRYCARMTGSVIDGEDVLQEALFNASRAIREGAVVDNLRPWLFRIAHNTALNALRSGKKERAMKEEVGREIPVSETMPMRSEVGDTLRPFLALTARQRSTVILRDVLGYSAAEVADLTESSVQSVKSALHRGRSLLRDQGHDDEVTPTPPLSDAERRRLDAYADCFNDHQFDRLRDMLSAEVRLELVGRLRSEGRREVGNYFGNYSDRDDWLMAPGRIEGRPALLSFDRHDPSGPPRYFVLLAFDGEDVLSIRDFRYARYVMADARWERLPR